MSRMQSTILTRCTGVLSSVPGRKLLMRRLIGLAAAGQPPHDGRSLRPRNRPGKLPSTEVAGQGRFALRSMDGCFCAATAGTRLK